MIHNQLQTNNRWERSSSSSRSTKSYPNRRRPERLEVKFVQERVYVPEYIPESIEFPELTPTDSINNTDNSSIANINFKHAVEQETENKEPVEESISIMDGIDDDEIDFNSHAKEVIGHMCSRWEQYKEDYEGIHGNGAYEETYGYNNTDIFESDDEVDESDNSSVEGDY
tara:strand:- start:2102 stop:2611 length:510 start_codon:yes stop_codon:yes gene_type:complete